MRSFETIVGLAGLTLGTAALVNILHEPQITCARERANFGREAVEVLSISSRIFNKENNSEVNYLQECPFLEEKWKLYREMKLRVNQECVADDEGIDSYALEVHQSVMLASAQHAFDKNCLK